MWLALIEHVPTVVWIACYLIRAEDPAPLPTHQPKFIAGLFPIIRAVNDTVLNMYHLRVAIVTFECFKHDLAGHVPIVVWVACCYVSELLTILQWTSSSLSH